MPIYHPGDDHLFEDVLTKKQNPNAGQNIIPPKLPDTKGKPPAQSQWSTGRNCPKCSNDLYAFEFSEETLTQWVKCKQCGSTYSHQDLESDDVYRLIPEDMILRYMEAFAREKGV